MLADHQRRSLHQDVARGLDLVGIVPEPGRARLLEGVSLEHHAKRQCVRRAPRGPGDRGGVLKRPRRDRRGHLASLARIDTTPRTSRQSTRRDATARARSRLCERPRRRFRTRPGSEKGAKREFRSRALRKMAKQIARRPSLAAHDANARCRSRCAGDLDVILDVSAAYSRGRTLFTHTRVKTALSTDGRRKDRDVSESRA